MVRVTDTAAAPSWLATAPDVERVPLDEWSWIDIVRGFVPAADQVHDEVLAAATWEPSRVWRYERWVDEPRMFGREQGGGHPALAEGRAWFRRRYHVDVAATALVRYRDERDSVGFHRDRELRWLDDTLIGVLTLGAHRPWLMRPLTGRRAEYDDDDMASVIDLSPGSGDLIVMGGRCQADWLHAVPKTRERCRDRIAAQWRWTSRRGRRDPNPTYYAPRHFGR